jgi:hypothetical protein
VTHRATIAIGVAIAAFATACSEERDAATLVEPNAASTASSMFSVVGGGAADRVLLRQIADATRPTHALQVRLLVRGGASQRLMPPAGTSPFLSVRASVATNSDIARASWEALLIGAAFRDRAAPRLRPSGFSVAAVFTDGRKKLVVSLPARANQAVRADAPRTSSQVLRTLQNATRGLGLTVRAVRISRPLGSAFVVDVALRDDVAEFQKDASAYIGPILRSLLSSDPPADGAFVEVRSRTGDLIQTVGRVTRLSAQIGWRNPAYRPERG